VTEALIAEGFLGIVMGFVAQASISNFISGLLPVLERPFKLGDFICVGGYRNSDGDGDFVDHDSYLGRSEGAHTELLTRPRFKYRTRRESCGSPRPSKQRRALSLALRSSRSPMLTSAMLYVLFVVVKQQFTSSAVRFEPELGVSFQFLYADLSRQRRPLKRREF